MNSYFGRVVTAMVTPFKEDYSINLDQAKKLALHLINNGTDSLVLAGTTGENPTLDKQEKIALFHAIVKEVDGKAQVIASTGGNSTKETIALTETAQQVGVDAVMVVAPYYNKPSQDGIYRHFKDVAENTDLPIMIYNVPGRTSVNILPPTVSKLSRISNIVAIKEASGSMDQISEIRRLVPDNFAVYSGDDSMTLPILAVGGQGVVSVASHIVGTQIKTMIEAFFSGNHAAAIEIHLKLFPFFKDLFITTNPVPIKAALNQLGWSVGRPRLPLIEATIEEVQIITSSMSKINLL